MDTQLESLAGKSQLTRRATHVSDSAALSDFEIDRTELARVGKKQVLKVG